LKEKGRDYAARVYDGVEFSKDGSVLVVSGRSRPTHFLRKPVARYFRRRFDRLLGPPSRFNLVPLSDAFVLRTIIVTEDLRGLAIVDLLYIQGRRSVAYSCRFPILGEVQSDGREEFSSLLGQEKVTIRSRDSLKTSSLHVESQSCPWGRKSSLVKEGEIPKAPSFSCFIVNFEPFGLSQEIRISQTYSSRRLWDRSRCAPST
jgi:hypothetical protein